MKKLLLLLTAFPLLFISCQEEDNPSGVKEVTILCATGEADEITVNSATLKGTVLISDAESDQAEAWFLIGTDAATVAESGTKVSAGTIPAKGGNVSAIATELEPGTTYYFVVEVSIDGKKSSGEVSSFTTLSRPKEIIVTAEAVDLGLSVMWSSCNLGAEKPEDYGDYYAWGETETKENYSWGTYKWCNGDYNNLTKYNNSSSYGTVDNKTVLETEDDVAHVKLGGNWRIPTISEVDELISTRNNASYQWEWKSLNGHNGWLVTYLVNNNSIFLPAAGYRVYTNLYDVGSSCFFWSSSLYTDNPDYAYALLFDSGDIYAGIDFLRHFGFSVRPVQDYFTTADFSASVTTGDATDVGPFEATISGSLTVESGDDLSRSVWFLWGDGNNLEALKASGNSLYSTLGGDGRFTCTLKGLNHSTTYYYVACAWVQNREYFGEVKSFTTKEFGFAAIDMGLSVKWANANLGANEPWDFGDYYAWGETETKENYSWGTYKWCNGDYNNLTKYNTDSSYGTVDKKTVLEAEDDVAHVKLGGKWRMPTISEVYKLMSTRDNASYQWEWMSLNGHNGWLVTYLVNNNSIFLPAAGYRVYTNLYDVGSSCFFWSSSLYTDNPDYAYALLFDSGDIYAGIDFLRHFGFSVRPVQDYFTTADFSASVTTGDATDVGPFEATISGSLTVESGDDLSRSVWFLWGDGNNLEALKASGNSLYSTLGGDGRFTCTLKGLNHSTTYYYVACAWVQNREYFGEVKSFTTKEFGFAAIDMGLSVKWANANLGANEPWDFGDYYAWGETETKENYSWGTYKWCNGDYNNLTKYNTDSSYGTVDKKTVLEAEDDVAHVKLGGNWRMPTSNEVVELISTRDDASYQWEWKSINGHNGWLVTYLVNNNSIFLPAAGCRDVADLHDVGSYGYYWSSSLYTGNPYGAYGLGFFSDFVNRYFINRRCYGFSVRPVSE